MLVFREIQPIWTSISELIQGLNYETIKPGWQFFSQIPPSILRCSEHWVGRRRLLGWFLAHSFPFPGAGTSKGPQDFSWAAWLCLLPKPWLWFPDLGWTLTHTRTIRIFPWGFLSWNQEHVVDLSVWEVAPRGWTQELSEPCSLPHEAGQSADENVAFLREERQSHVVFKPQFQVVPGSLPLLKIMVLYLSKSRLGLN